MKMEYFRWMEPHRILFIIRSVYDLLRTLTILCKQSPTENMNCELWWKRGTLAYVLSSYSGCLAQGRYRWRHNQVLSRYPEKERKKKRGWKEEKKFINYVREVEATSVEKLPNQKSILDFLEQLPGRCRRTLDDGWYFQTSFRQNSALTLLSTCTSLLWSHEYKKIIMVELTVPENESKVLELSGRHS